MYNICIIITRCEHGIAIHVLELDDSMINFPKPRRNEETWRNSGKSLFYRLVCIVSMAIGHGTWCSRTWIFDEPWSVDALWAIYLASMPGVLGKYTGNHWVLPWNITTRSHGPILGMLIVYDSLNSDSKDLPVIRPAAMNGFALNLQFIPTLTPFEHIPIHQLCLVHCRISYNYI